MIILHSLFRLLNHNVPQREKSNYLSTLHYLTPNLNKPIFSVFFICWLVKVGQYLLMGVNDFVFELEMSLEVDTCFKFRFTLIAMVISNIEMNSFHMFFMVMLSVETFPTCLACIIDNFFMNFLYVLS